LLIQTFTYRNQDESPQGGMTISQA